METAVTVTEVAVDASAARVSKKRKRIAGRASSIVEADLCVREAMLLAVNASRGLSVAQAVHSVRQGRHVTSAVRAIEDAMVRLSEARAAVEGLMR